MTPESDDVRERRLLAYLAAGLVAGGTPVYEVEEDVRAVAASLGRPHVQVSAAPTGVFVALGSGEATAFERVEGGLRLDQLAKVNTVRAGLVAGSLTVDEALAVLGELRLRPHRYAASGVVAGSVSVGGGIALVLAPAPSSAAFGVLLGPVVALLMLLSRHSRLLRTILPAIASFVVASVALWVHARGWIAAPMWTLVPPIAVLLPGATIVTGLSELAGGSMVTGTARLAYGGVQLLEFVVGVALAAALTRPDPSVFVEERPHELGWWAGLIGVVLVVVGITLMESVPVSLAMWVLPLVLATFAAFSLGQALNPSPWVGAFLGAAVASAGAALAEFIRPELPRVVVFLPSFWLLVPGSMGLVSLSQFEADPAAALASGITVAAVVTAIAMGVLVGAAAAGSLRLAARRLGLRRMLVGAAHLQRPHLRRTTHR